VTAQRLCYRHCCLLASGWLQRICSVAQADQNQQLSTVRPSVYRCRIQAELIACALPPCLAALLFSAVQPHLQHQAPVVECLRVARVQLQRLCILLRCQVQRSNCLCRARWLHCSRQVTERHSPVVQRCMRVGLELQCCLVPAAGLQSAPRSGTLLGWFNATCSSAQRAALAGFSCCCCRCCGSKQFSKAAAPIAALLVRHTQAHRNNWRAGLTTHCHKLYGHRRHLSMC
jgi:hypothetical protein